jgi:hypothetical protein
MIPFHKMPSGPEIISLADNLSPVEFLLVSDPRSMRVLTVSHNLFILGRGACGKR